MTPPSVTGPVAESPVRRRWRHIEAQPVAGALGAEIRGVDIARPLSDEVVAEIREAFLDHLVIFFRGQQLSPVQQVEFARRFGEPMEYPQLKGLPECPLITPVVKLESERVNFGGIWHSDTAYLERPPMASMLYAVEIPPYGGDTLFANQYLAYETLSERFRQLLAGLVGMNTSTKADASRTREDRLRSAGAELKVLVGEHPVVRKHPETGRKALYVNPAFTLRIEGWKTRESKALLDYLFDHCRYEAFTTRFQWAKGSVAFWDNRSVWHFALNDYPGQRRHMRRVTVDPWPQAQAVAAE